MLSLISVYMTTHYRLFRWSFLLIGSLSFFSDSLYAIPKPKTTRPRHAPGYIAPERKQAIEEMISLVQETTNLLKGARDTRSADALRDHMWKLRERTLKLHKEVYVYLTADKGEMQATVKLYGKRVKESFDELAKEIKRLEAVNFYDSRELYFALRMVHPYSRLEGLDGTILNMPVFETERERQAFIDQLRAVRERKYGRGSFGNSFIYRIPPSVETERRRIKEEQKQMHADKPEGQDNN